MTAHSVLYLTVLVALATICSAEIKDFKMEPQCAQVGGMCIMKDECPEEITADNIGLCPNQQAEGAECCHGISTKEYRCHRLGGECFPQSEACRPTLRISRATDCEADSVCCQLF